MDRPPPSQVRGLWVDPAITNPAPDGHLRDMFSAFDDDPAAWNLPPLVEGTAGLAHPKPGVFVAYTQPSQHAFVGGTSHTGALTARLDASPNDVHVVVAATGSQFVLAYTHLDNHPQAVDEPTYHFDGFCLIDNNSAAAALYGFWMAMGDAVQIGRAVRLRPAEVLGQVGSCTTPAGLVTPHGEHLFASGYWLLREADGRLRFVADVHMHDEFSHVASADGQEIRRFC